MEVSEILKEARTKKGMTQQELADCVYVTRQTISKWELGKSVPDEASLRLLYKCLDIDNNDKNSTFTIYCSFCNEINIVVLFHYKYQKCL